VSDIKISEFPQIVGPITGNEFVPLVIANENFKAALSQLGIPFTVTGVTPGSYGGSNQVPGMTVNSYGQITAIANVPIEFDGSDITTGTVALARGGTGSGTASGARVNLLPSYVGNAGKALAVNSGATDVEWISLAGAGTVTSIDVSGGTTGLTTSGGPITAAGTITIAGTLAPTSGGTGITGFSVGDLLFANTTTQLDRLAVGVAGYLLYSNGTAPAYINPASITVGSATTATTATNIAGGAAGSIPYQTGSGATSLLATGSGVLVGGTTPSYSTTPTLTGTNFTGIPNGALTNSSVTVGTTAISLGASSLTLGGLTSVAVTQDPTTALQLATKQYVDTLVSSGITYHLPVKYEVPNTTGNLTAIYNQPGGAGDGVGATLTNNGTKAAFAPDGPTASVGDRILVYNQTNAFENGVYTVTTVGTPDPGGTNWVLTRATDADTYGLKDTDALGNGDAFFVTSGDTGAGETYICNAVSPIVFGTTAISFVQISDSTLYTAGNGLQLTSGTIFSLIAPVTTVNGGTGLTSFTSGGAVYATSTSALTTGTLPVASGGTGATTLTGVVIGNGTSAFTTVTAPSGAIVGTTDTQNLTSKTLTTGNTLDAGTSISDTGTIAATSPGFRGLPQNAQTASYTLALTDAGKHISTTSGGVIVPANGSVAFPIGSTIVIYNNSSSSQTISITTDTMYLAGSATTGSRTLAQRGLATLVKVASTTWAISGAGVS
jgi:hypothetical protein